MARFAPMAQEGLDIGFTIVPWGILGLLLVIALGLFIIRAALTLVKVAIVIAIGVGIWLVVEFIINMIAKNSA